MASQTKARDSARPSEWSPAADAEAIAAARCRSAAALWRPQGVGALFATGSDHADEGDHSAVKEANEKKRKAQDSSLPREEPLSERLQASQKRGRLRLSRVESEGGSSDLSEEVKGEPEEVKGEPEEPQVRDLIRRDASGRLAKDAFANVASLFFKGEEAQTKEAESEYDSERSSEWRLKTFGHREGLGDDWDDDDDDDDDDSGSETLSPGGRARLKAEIQQRKEELMRDKKKLRRMKKKRKLREDDDQTVKTGSPSGPGTESDTLSPVRLSTEPQTAVGTAR